LTTKVLLLVLLISPVSLLGQSRIYGEIIDATTREALVGVNIALADASGGTTTDANGFYSLLLSEDLGPQVKVEISYLGYLGQTIEVNNSGRELLLNIDMEMDVLQLQEIVISANKRAQSSQKVAMSITTLNALQLKRSGAKLFRDYASGIPNLSFDTQGAGLYGRFDNGIAIRGISGTFTTSMYLDEVPLPENMDPRLLDVERVEILKGPQGTLYGSRNMGGAVKVMSNKPSTKQIEGSLGLSLAKVKEGDWDYGSELVLNLPINDKIAFRAMGYYDFESGIFDRKINLNADILNLVTTIETELPDGTPFAISTDGCPGCNLSDKENIDDERNYGFAAGLGLFPNDKISIFPKVIFQKQAGDGYDFAEGTVDNKLCFHSTDLIFMTV